MFTRKVRNTDLVILQKLTWGKCMMVDMLLHIMEIIRIQEKFIFLLIISILILSCILYK